jgi:hypothetical protein
MAPYRSLRVRTARAIVLAPVAPRTSRATHGVLISARAPCCRISMPPSSFQDGGALRIREPQDLVEVGVVDGSVGAHGSSPFSPDLLQSCEIRM